MQFASLKEVQDSDVAFSEVYHRLIHSPALETLLQLEHTYAIAMSELYKAWENARELMQTRYGWPGFHGRGCGWGLGMRLLARVSWKWLVYWCGSG